MMCIDSNIWIYYLSSRAPEHRAVTKAIRKVLLKEEEILTNPSIILEVAHYFRSLPKEKLLKIFDYITGLQNLIFVGLDIPLLENSVAILAKYAEIGLGARDATILASMQQAGVKRIMTHDSIFRKIKNIDIIDPLE